MCGYAHNVTLYSVYIRVLQRNRTSYTHTHTYAHIHAYTHMHTYVYIHTEILRNWLVIVEAVWDRLTG